MSRIEEALRRAAHLEQAGDSGDTAVAIVPAPAEDLAYHEVDTLAREAFPIERQARTPAPNGTSDAPGSGEPAWTPSPPPAPAAEPDTRADQPTGSLFDRIDHALAEKVVADRNISPLSREQYRRLAAVLHDAQTNTGLSVVMIASALSGEGKTLTASNLALTLSESYQKRVLLIDADLRKPALHQVFRINSAIGLSTGLESGSDDRLTVHQVSPCLSVLPAGRPTSDPMAGLVSDRMRRLIDEARETFDWVIVDTPPIVLLPDANLLAAMVQGTILVVQAGSTPHELVKRAINAIGAPRIIGTVLNQAEMTTSMGYGYSGYAYYGNGSRYLQPTETASRS